MDRFSLVGVDGNAFAIMGYTARALKKVGLNDKVDEMYEKAKSGNYYQLIATCDDYIAMANKELAKKENSDVCK